MTSRMVEPINKINLTSLLLNILGMEFPCSISKYDGQQSMLAFRSQPVTTVCFLDLVIKTLFGCLLLTSLAIEPYKWRQQKIDYWRNIPFLKTQRISRHRKYVKNTCGVSNLCQLTISQAPARMFVQLSCSMSPPTHWFSFIEKSRLANIGL